MTATLSEQITAELDETLIARAAARQEHRTAEDAERTAMARLSDLDQRAQRLRLALCALVGDERTTPGDANRINHDRERELAHTPITTIEEN